MSKYRVIYADPPWAFRTYSGKTTTPHRSAEDHYTTLSIEDLCNSPAPQVAAKDCVLFLWVVDSHLPEALRLIEAWGFTYKTKAFTWVKMVKDGSRPGIGMGYWTRKSSEICLLATKGKPKRKGKGVREVLLQPRREHSRKPDDFYERIEALVDGPYLELFARNTRPGWDSWGNEVEKHDD